MATAKSLSAPVLTTHELNRATLARQLLLERTAMPALDAVEHLVGLQAQNPHGTYPSLLARLEGFQPTELSELLAKRRVVRIVVMRGTVHMVSARDCLEWWPLTQPVLARTFRGSTFSKELGGADLAEVLDAGRRVLEAEPMIRSAAGRRLGERWPDAQTASLGHALGYGLPLVQMPPRGLWGQGGQAKLTTAEKWLGSDLEAEPSIDRLVLRYLGTFGPATVKDFQSWSGLTRIAEVAERLRPKLRSFRSEDGRELFDLPDAPRPGADVEAPPRFLPEYDNVLLGHADRTRFVDADARSAKFFTGSGLDSGTLLAAGVLSATWKLTRDDDAAELWVRPFKRISRRDRAGIEAEAELLFELIAAEAGERRLRISAG